MILINDLTRESEIKKKKKKEGDERERCTLHGEEDENVFLIIQVIVFAGRQAGRQVG